MEQDRLVRWQFRTRYGLSDSGRMPKRNVQRELLRCEVEAAKVLRDTEADHVLYGVKKYTQNGLLSCVTFYLWPMTDEEFENRVVQNSAGLVVYAVHKHS